MTTHHRSGGSDPTNGNETMIRLALCFLLVTTAAWAADVDRSLCRDIDETTRALVPTELRPWFQFEHAVQACPAYDRKHRFLWWIIGIDLEFEPYEALENPVFHPLNPGGFSRRCTPNPYILDSDGRELGRISDAFPSGGFPSRTDLFFSQWVDGFPHHITVKVFNARAMGDYIAPPLQWNTRTKTYDQIGKGTCDMPPPLKEK
jgi:hypothetical protein